ncbi:7-cyano-7-deazaguanine synthase [Billgrantia saliphila]|uniref:7-cyano-7-deazaguanine synthase n=1 Tax=Billgrantia saliphila TaxID=1848458 RepID=UPI0018CC3647|nr:7-cyano-7-deazaguanine synthase [Halomonas saliphila]
MCKTINVLWTGGWDSTFRVLFSTLVDKNEVKPHYIIDLNRKSSLHELKAISEIRNEFKKNNRDAAARIGALNITLITEIEPIEEITTSYLKLKEKSHLGKQYDWLSRYARSKKINDLELSVHVDDKAYLFLQGNVEKGTCGRWKLRGNAEGDIKIFSCFSFPLLELSKAEMREQAKNLGFREELEKSWFCFNPKADKPCGICNPCIYTIEEGMGYRLPSDAILRYRTRHVRKAISSPVRVSRNFIASMAKGWL